MPLTLVLGPANSAKAGEVLGAYSAAARRDARLVVPTAADALHYDRELAGEGVHFGRTLTFAGLLSEIAARVGIERTPLGVLARDLLIRRAIAATPLELLGDSAATPGFPGAVARLIATLRGQRVSPGRFTQALTAWPEGARHRELAGIYRRYQAMLSATGREDGEGWSWEVLDALAAAPERWGQTAVFLYGFDDLTVIEQAAVETLAERVGIDLWVSLTYEPGRVALAARGGVAESLRARAARVRELPALATYYAAPQLHHLERRLFEGEAAAPMEAEDAAMVLEAGGERAEAELVAAEVLAALADGVPPEEIVVVCRSLRRSGARLEAALNRYGVPSTSARQIPFTHTALGRGVRAALRGEALEFLRLTRPPEEVDPLEATARRTGTAVTARLPELSEAIAALLPRGDGAALSPEAALDVRAAGVLESALAEVGPIDAAELLELLERLEVPAGGRSGVLVAEPLAIRARRFRRVFLTGLCDGEFPPAVPADPFLSEDARRGIAQASGLIIEAAPDPLARERYLLYAALSRATERIIVAYRSSDEEGNAVAASPFLDDVLAHFGTVPRRRRLLADVIWSPSEAPTLREYGLAAAGVTVGSPPPAGRSETRTLSPAALGRVRHVERVSPGAMELFARCPVAWLVQRQLAPAPLAPEPEPLVKGTFMHELLARVLAGEPDVLSDVEAPRDLAPAESPAVRRALVAGIVAELTRYLGWEAAHPRPGFRTVAIEHAFEVRLAAGLTVSGIIDRVDANAAGQAIVVDYKSGSDRPERAAARWLADHTFQVGLYMLAVARELELAPIAGVYQPLAGRDLRPRGAASAAAGLALRATDVLDDAALEDLLAGVEAEVDRLAAQLRSGALTPCPETCSPDGCRHPGICWAGR